MMSKQRRESRYVEQFHKRVTIPIDWMNALGVNEAIVLARFDFWIYRNEANDKVKRDGRVWSYRAYPEWQKDDFPFMSISTLGRVIRKLESLHLVLSNSTYNKMPMDRTKWYTIDYKALDMFFDYWYTCECPSVVQPKKTDDDVNVHEAFLNEWRDNQYAKMVSSSCQVDTMSLFQIDTSNNKVSKDKGNKDIAPSSDDATHSNEIGTSQESFNASDEIDSDNVYIKYADDLKRDEMLSADTINAMSTRKYNQFKYRLGMRLMDKMDYPFITGKSGNDRMANKAVNCIDDNVKAILKQRVNTSLIDSFARYCERLGLEGKYRPTSIVGWASPARVQAWLMDMQSRQAKPAQVQKAESLEKAQMFYFGGGTVMTAEDGTQYLRHNNVGWTWYTDTHDRPIEVVDNRIVKS